LRFVAARDDLVCCHHCTCALVHLLLRVLRLSRTQPRLSTSTGYTGHTDDQPYRCTYDDRCQLVHVSQSSPVCVTMSITNTAIAAINTAIMSPLVSLNS